MLVTISYKFNKNVLEKKPSMDPINNQNIIVHIEVISVISE